MPATAVDYDTLPVNLVQATAGIKTVTVFPQILALVPDPSPKTNRRILPESTPVLRIRCHLWWKERLRV